MQIIRGTTEFELSERSAVAIGKFDGIHLGHQKLLARILEWKKEGFLAAVFTFDPAPEAFFGGHPMKELMTVEEKRLAFEKMGIDVLIEFPLNNETAATKPERFVTEYLTAGLRAGVIVAGTDLSFGARGQGDAKLLQSMAKDLGYRVELIDKVCLAGEEISSTLIREAVSRGDMEKVTALLGMPYQISGVVAHGKKLGRTMGMPTVNLLPDEDKLLPPRGVYYSYVRLEDRRCPAISNIGCKPTVSDTQIMGLETYLYDFDKTLYDKEITVELLHFKRPEMRFENVEALKKQMEKDLAEGKAFHKMNFS